MPKSINKESIIRVVKFTFSSGISFVVDLALFTVISPLLGAFWGTIVSRIISSFVNYFINSRYVFKKQGKGAIFKYYLLVVIQMLVSAVSVSFLVSILPIHSTIIKIAVDVVIFIVNYCVQKFIIFR